MIRVVRCICPSSHGGVAVPPNILLYSRCAAYLRIPVSRRPLRIRGFPIIDSRHFWSHAVAREVVGQGFGGFGPSPLGWPGSGTSWPERASCAETFDGSRR